VVITGPALASTHSGANVQWGVRMEAPGADSMPVRWIRRRGCATVIIMLRDLPQSATGLERHASVHSSVRLVRVEVACGGPTVSGEPASTATKLIPRPASMASRRHLGAPLAGQR
jgi:hypothetical protein